MTEELDLNCVEVAANLHATTDYIILSYYLTHHQTHWQLPDNQKEETCIDHNKLCNRYQSLILWKKPRACYI